MVTAAARAARDTLLILLVVLSLTSGWAGFVKWWHYITDGPPTQWNPGAPRAELVVNVPPGDPAA